MKPELRVTVFSDYICPFCYVGDVRLNRLREEFDLKVSWCFVEIHPETALEGEPLQSLDVAPERWQKMMEGLKEMAAEDGLSFDNFTFVANSAAALQLAEATKFLDAEIFYRLHSRLFEAYFSQGQNIGDKDCLRKLALEAGLTESQFEAALSDESAVKRLAQYQAAATELSVRATPTFFIGESRHDGAVPYAQLLTAARTAVKQGSDV